MRTEGSGTPDLNSLLHSSYVWTNTSSDENLQGALAEPVLNVLVTGFGPFREHLINASWESVIKLPEDDILLPPNIKPSTKINLLLYQLPVVYDFVTGNMEALWKKYEPHLVIHVGVSGIATAITLEQFAHNDGYCSPDVCNDFPNENICVPGGCEVLKSGFDMKLVTNALNTSPEDEGIVAEFSCDPGRYLCDFTYYKSLSIDKNRAAFIHVPPLNKPWSASEMAGAIRTCVTEFIRQLQEKNLLGPSFSIGAAAAESEYQEITSNELDVGSS